MEAVGVGRSPRHIRLIMEVWGGHWVDIPVVRVGHTTWALRFQQMEARVFFIVEGVVEPAANSQMGGPVDLLYTAAVEGVLGVVTAAALSDLVVCRYMAGPVGQALGPLARVA